MPEAGARSQSLWAVRDAECDGSMIALLPVPGHQGTYSVGRHESVDIRIDGDKSVSRRHLELSIESGGALLLKDLGAKFGTTVGGQILPPNGSIVLADAQEVQLGTRKLLVTREPIGFCMSGLTRPDAERLQDASVRMGAGRVNKEWLSGTTHLVMQQLKLTPKLLLALAHCCPIISPDWVISAAARTRASQPLPPTEGEATAADDVLSFTPSSATQLPSGCLRVQPVRRLLFSGRRFVYLPGGEAAARSQNQNMLQAMGASEVLNIPAADAPSLAQLVASGFELLMPEGLKPAEEDALEAAAGQAGGRVYNVSLVRLCLVHANLDYFVPNRPPAAPQLALAPGGDTEGGTCAQTPSQTPNEAPAAAEERPPVISHFGAGEAALSRTPALTAAVGTTGALVGVGGTTPACYAAPAAATASAGHSAPAQAPPAPAAAFPSKATLAAAAAAPSPATGRGSPASPCPSPLPSSEWRTRPNAAGGSAHFFFEAEPGEAALTVSCDAPVLHGHGVGTFPSAPSTTL
eukprot:scaffold15922_cov111-Isochrysis_galbana.AAC.5